MPLLIKGIDNANNYLSLTKAQQEEAKKAQTGRADERVFFHLPFHLQTTRRTHPQVLFNVSGKIYFSPHPVKRF